MVAGQDIGKIRFEVEEQATYQHDGAYGNGHPVSRSRSSPVPEVVAGSGTMQISNIMGAISMCIHITHVCMNSKNLIMWSHTE